MNISQLYPEYKEYAQYRGIYLDDPLLSDRNAAIVYSNFLSSLDGRIAISKDGIMTLPSHLSRAIDLRLFLELQAQSDCIITHGGYLRALAAGRLNNILHIGLATEHADLADWRRQRGLPRQPLVVVCSNSMTFSIPESLAARDVWIATSGRGDAQRIETWQERGYRVVRAGARRVEGGALTTQLTAAGYRRMYLCSGPEFFESCLADRCLHLHYMTIAAQFIGHPEFLTLLGGYADLKHCRPRLARLIVNRTPAADYDQLYLSFTLHYSDT